jgi:hypothetical protein
MVSGGPDDGDAAASQLTPHRNIPVAGFRQGKVDRDGDRRGGADLKGIEP